MAKAKGVSGEELIRAWVQQKLARRQAPDQPSTETDPLCRLVSDATRQRPVLSAEQGSNRRREERSREKNGCGTQRADRFAVVRSQLRDVDRQHGLLLNFAKTTLEPKRVLGA